MAQGSLGKNSNRNVRTRSNGRRSRHGYNYWLELIHCLEVNRELKRRARKATEEMFGSVAEAFSAARERQT